MEWRPLSVRNNPEGVRTYDALHEGVPAWLQEGVRRWVRNALESQGIVESLQYVEQFLRFPLDWNRDALVTVTNEIVRDTPRALDILDCCLMLLSLSGRWEFTAGLETMLQIGGSAWTVGRDQDGHACLYRRVDETVEQAAKAEMDQAGNAAQHLRIAWHRAYRRNPDASSAYREAVRAVEAAAKPTISPTDSVATLGKMITAIRDKPEKWIAVLGSVDVVAAMMSQLWKAQLDRHGTDDDTVPLSVSPEQAEAAVQLAVTLVHWFRNGHMRAV